MSGCDDPRSAVRSFKLSVPAEACFLQSVRAFFKPILAPLFGEDADKLILALDESCANLLKHQCPHGAVETLRVSAEIGGGRARFRVEDFCDHDDVAKIKPRPLGEVRPGGLGTHFVGKIMDRVEFEPEAGRPGRMTLLLEKAIPR